ncbi:hypothetical protein [Rhizobium leguminosarum]|uniref:Uncharacterized protein n=1 Tax=Rhizobium leguminosarum TaxID=384 RepID=A0A2K9ZGJ5_RHILE|nr:hypothetical protein [Rhizobium leguminosarum]AUW47161.1 hypothetical protein CUJ84_pRLN3000019 [Rhizobium leguminosarum]
MTTDQNVTFDDVLTFLLEEDVTPSHENLLQWIQRYPQFSDDLTNYFAEWAVQAETGDEEIVQSRSERFVNIGVSHALNLLHARKANAVPSARAQARTLAQFSRAVGLTFASLAAKVRLDEEIVTKLDLCRIPVASIPTVLATMLSELLKVGVEEVWRALSLPPRATSPRALQKSRGPAQVRTESFKDAITASAMPPEQKEEWLRSIEKGTGPP